MKCWAITFFAWFILLPCGAISEEPLAVYRQLKGSFFETKLLQYVRDSIVRQFDPSAPVRKPDIENEHLPPVGLYVSLMKRRNVRACVGSFYAFESDLLRALHHLAKEVIYKDIRSRPLSLSEMRKVSVVISFVGPVREIENPHSIDFSEEGLFVSQAEKGLVLLPGETKTLDYGLARLRKQNNFDPHEPVRYASFKVVVFDERSK